MKMSRTVEENRGGKNMNSHRKHMNSHRKQDSMVMIVLTREITTITTANKKINDTKLRKGPTREGM